MIMSNGSLRTRPLVESDRRLRFTELCNQEANQSAKRGGELKSATDIRRTKKKLFFNVFVIEINDFAVHEKNKAYTNE